MRGYIARHRATEASELAECGRTHLLTGSYFELERAAVEAAIDRDQAYALAYAWLALARCEQAHAEARPTDRAYDEAKRVAFRAPATGYTRHSARRRRMPARRR